MLEPNVRRRLGAAFIVAGLLVPTFCAFPVLAIIAGPPLRWVILGIWVVIGGALGLVVRRIQVLLAERALEQTPDQ